MPGITTIGGYSGHGVMLSNYCGKLYAEDVTGGSAELDHLKALKIPAFPGGARFRSPLLFLAMTWYADVLFRSSAGFLYVAFWSFALTLAVCALVTPFTRPLDEEALRELVYRA